MRERNFIIFDGNHLWQTGRRTSQAGRTTRSAATRAVCTLKKRLTWVKLELYWSQIPTWEGGTSACRARFFGRAETFVKRFWLSRAFQIVNCTPRRTLCSLNVIPRPDECYLGYMTGLTFFFYFLAIPFRGRKVIFSHFLSSSLSLHTHDWWTHAHCSCRLKRKKKHRMCFQPCMHTHTHTHMQAFTALSSWFSWQLFQKWDSSTLYSWPNSSAIASAEHCYPWWQPGPAQSTNSQCKLRHSLLKVVFHFILLCIKLNKSKAGLVQDEKHIPVLKLWP